MSHKPLHFSLTRSIRSPASLEGPMHSTLSSESEKPPHLARISRPPGNAPGSSKSDWNHSTRLLISSASRLEWIGGWSWKQSLGTFSSNLRRSPTQGPLPDAEFSFAAKPASRGRPGPSEVSPEKAGAAVNVIPSEARNLVKLLQESRFLGL